MKATTTHLLRHNDHYNTIAGRQKSIVMWNAEIWGGGGAHCFENCTACRLQTWNLPAFFHSRLGDASPPPVVDLVAFSGEVAGEDRFVCFFFSGASSALLRLLGRDTGSGAAG